MLSHQQVVLLCLWNVVVRIGLLKLVTLCAVPVLGYGLAVAEGEMAHSSAVLTIAPDEDRARMLESSQELLVPSSRVCVGLIVVIGTQGYLHRSYSEIGSRVALKTVSSSSECRLTAVQHKAMEFWAQLQQFIWHPSSITSQWSLSESCWTLLTVPSSIQLVQRA